MPQQVEAGNALPRQINPQVCTLCEKFFDQPHSTSRGHVQKVVGMAMLDCLLGKPGDTSSLQNLDGRCLSVPEGGTLNPKAIMNFWGKKINLFANRMGEIIKFRGAVFTKLGAAGSSTIAIPSRCVERCRTHLVVYRV